MGIERLAFEMDDGVLSVLAAGPVDGPRVVLLHGIPASAELFADVLPHLAEAGFREDCSAGGRAKEGEVCEVCLSPTTSTVRWGATTDGPPIVRTFKDVR